MRNLFRALRRGLPAKSSVLETAGIVLTSLGIQEISTPAALIFAGAVLVFIAQGMERDE